MRSRVVVVDKGQRWALICRGLTGSLSMKSSLDELAEALGRHGWSSLRFDYRYSLNPSTGRALRTLNSMREDVTQALSRISVRTGHGPDVVIGRGFGARLALEALRGHPNVPLIMWTPIIWLRTSLEIRWRLHEIRRCGFTEFDKAKVGAQFVTSLKDPIDKQIKSWIVPTRRHVIVCAKDDRVVPARLIEETMGVITSTGATVEVISVPGDHPHPGEDVSQQIAKIVDVVGNLV